MSKKINGDYLLRKIKHLKKSARQHRSNNQPGQRRYWMYGYLKDVYEVFLEFEEKEISKQAGRRIIKLLQLTINKKSHVVRVLIEASAGREDNRTKIKWTNALRHAHGWLQPPDRLEWHFGASGGIAGCAAKFALLKKARRQRKLKEAASSGEGSALSAFPSQLQPAQAQADRIAGVGDQASN